MSRGFKIFMLILLSIVFGVAGLFGTLALLNLVFNARVDLDRYGTVFAVTTAIPIGLLAAVWLDKLMNVGILPDGMVNQGE